MVDQEKDDFSSHKMNWDISDKNKDQNKNTNEHINNIAKTIPQIDTDLHNLQDNILDQVTEKWAEIWDLWVQDVIHETQEKLTTVKESIHIPNSLEQQNESVEKTNNKPQKRLLQKDRNQKQKELTQNTFTYPTAETIAQNKLQAAERTTTILQNLSNPEYISNPNWFMRNVILPITENIGKNT